MPDDGSAKQDGQIPTNLRLLLVLEEVARAGIPVLPSAVGEALGLPKPTIHRLLVTAEEQGFLQRDIDGRSYGPGRRMRQLSMNTLSSHRVRSERLRILKVLAEEVGETCNLAAPGRDGMVYLDRVETHWPLRIQLPIGSRVPFHCTASGKMYLASLGYDRLDRLLSNYELTGQTKRTFTDVTLLKKEIQKVRKLGYSTDTGEFLDGMAAIAVPICDDQGRLLSTLSIHAPLQRMSLEGLIENLDRLKTAVDQLESLVEL